MLNHYKYFKNFVVKQLRLSKKPFDFVLSKRRKITSHNSLKSVDNTKGNIFIVTFFITSTLAATKLFVWCFCIFFMVSTFTIVGHKNYTLAGIGSVTCTRVVKSKGQFGSTVLWADTGEDCFPSNARTAFLQTQQIFPSDSRFSQSATIHGPKK